MTIPSRYAENGDRGRARARRRARPRERALHRRRQQPRLPRVLRVARGTGDDRRPADQRAARVHQHAVQAARRLPAEGRRGRVGLASGAPHGGRRSRRRGLQGGPPADAGAPSRAVPALPADRRGVRVPESRVRRLGGGRRDRHAGDTCRYGGDQDLCRLDRPRRVPALQRERLPDDDAAGCCRRQRLHAGPGRGSVRRHSRAGAGLHRTQGRYLGQHPGRSGHR